MTNAKQQLDKRRKVELCEEIRNWKDGGIMENESGDGLNHRENYDFTRTGEYNKNLYPS